LPLIDADYFLTLYLGTGVSTYIAPDQASGYVVAQSLTEVLTDWNPCKLLIWKLLLTHVGRLKEFA